MTLRGQEESGPEGQDAPAHGPAPGRAEGHTVPVAGIDQAPRPAGGLAPLRRLWQKLREGGALMVGVPDYDRYVEHMRAQHPAHVPMTREAFVRARMEARYGGKGTGKCPC